MADGHANCCASRRPGGDSGRAATPDIVKRRARPAPHRWSGVIGGTFVMGSAEPGRFPADGEGPARDVSVSRFEIACHTVTNAQFGEFVRETGYTTDAERFGWSFVFEMFVPPALRQSIGRAAADTPWWIPAPHAYWAQPEGPHSTVLDRLEHPVVHVSWNDAKAYCDWAHAQLPTEAQWEFAARGGLDRKIYPWGDELMSTGRHRCNIWQGQFPAINTAEDGFAGTAPANAYEPNGYGLFCTVGNVWEWCEDLFSPDYHRTTSSVDPLSLTPTGSRSLRGGSFLCHDSYCNRYRVAARSSNTPESSASNIGFRVVRENMTNPA
jgi:formylglycine-generating enzyme required for sulfatase activity